MLKEDNYGEGETEDELSCCTRSTASESTITYEDQNRINNSHLGDFFDSSLPFNYQMRKQPGTRNELNKETEKDGIKPQHKLSTEQFYHVNLDTILKLKDSTKKLLCVLEEIQSKTHGKNPFIDNSNINLSSYLQPLPQTDDDLRTYSDFVGAKAIEKLETQTKALDSIYIQEEDDDCSVYKRLSRKCHCLNQQEYNDFIIHFNESTKFSTSIAGEIIKNMRILKKFLYMNGGYTKNALLFLNDGLTGGSHTEKSEIIQACAHADVCNVFEDYSIVALYISWPCKNEYYGDCETQALTAGFLYKLSQLEEGRRYLNYSSKITTDIKKVLRKKSTLIEYETMETLNSTLNFLNPPMTQNINVTYYCRPIDEGVGKKTMDSLINCRQYLTLEEIFTHLNLLKNLSNREKDKNVLTPYLPVLLILFKRLLVEYDNSEMNILISNILNNIVAKNIIKESKSDLPKTMVIADTATEPIQMKNVTVQHPPKKSIPKKSNKSKSEKELGVAPHKHPTPSKRTEGSRNTSVLHWESGRMLNRSRKFHKSVTRNSVIVVPIEKQNK